MTFKGLIEYGANYTPSQMATQSTFNGAQDAPLDGGVIRLMTNGGVEFSTAFWKGTTYTIDDLSQSITYLQQRRDLGWGRFRKIFVKAQQSTVGSIAPGWFGSEYRAMLDNYIVLGKAAALGGATGIWFDAEGYAPVWQYSAQPTAEKAAHSLEEYQVKAYKTGREIAAAWRHASPSLNIMVTNAYDGWAGRGKPYTTNEWELWKWFLDGLFDEYGETLYSGMGLGGGFASGSTATGKIILTTESMYLDRDTGHVLRYGVRQMLGTYDSYNDPQLPPSTSGSPPPDTNYWGGSRYFYDTSVKEIGLAIWVDYGTFDPLNPTTNYWTPALFKDCLSTMMTYCEWAWLYAPSYPFYGGADQGSGYTDKIRELRVTYGLY